MLKKCAILLVVCALTVSANVNLVYADIFHDVNEQGITKIEAEEFSEKTENYGHVKGFYRDYSSNNPLFPNKGCIALQPGRSLRYNLNIKKTGIYTVTAFFNATGQNAKFSIKVNSETVAERELTYTNNLMGPNTLDDVRLEKGTQYLDIMVNSGEGEYYYMYYLELEVAEEASGFSKASGSYRETYIPTIIQAEDFDIGPQASCSLDGKNNGGEYRKHDAIDIFKKPAGGYYIRLNEGEYVKYTFIAENTGDYNLSAAALNSGDIEVYFDDNAEPVEAKLKGGANHSETHIEDFHITKGEHVIKVVSKVNDLKLDYIRFLNGIVKNDSKPGHSDEQSAKTKNPIYRELYMAENGNDAGEGSINSPFQTFRRVKEEITKINEEMVGDIIVYIQPGIYKLSETEIFGPEHSGKNGFQVIFKGANIFAPPLISGGAKVEGWEKHTEQIWRAPLKNQEYVRNLYINSFPAVRAKSKYVYFTESYYSEPGSEYSRDGVSVSAKNFPESFAEPLDMELVWDYNWTNVRTPLTGIKRTPEKVNILLSRGIFNYSSTFTTDNLSFYLENAMELLDEPGEFYYNKKEEMIYYYPYLQEDMTTAQTYVGDTELMIKVLGKSPENKIENIIFDNLKFYYGAYNFASRYGYDGPQGDGMGNPTSGTSIFIAPDGSVGFAAQFEIYMADNVTIKNCEFACLGSTAVSMDDGVSNSLFEGNIIRDVSGTGIRIGTPLHHEKLEGMERCLNIDVKNNVIIRPASEFYNNIGISVYYERGINILNNDIYDTPYSGMSIGWGWSSNNPAYDQGNINVSYNRIENVMQTMKDGGGIYTLGRLEDSIISNNYIRNNQDRVGALIYHDAGSSFVETFKNVLIDAVNYIHVSAGRFGVRELTVRDNYYDGESNLYLVPPGPGENCSIEEGIALTEDEWPEEVQKIIANAGIAPQYARLKQIAAIPEWRKLRMYAAPRKEFEGDNSHIAGILIEAEDFMEGGEGVGFHKTLTPRKNNNAYRPEEVLLEKHGGRRTYAIATNAAGEWLNYELNIEKSGDYYIEVEGRQNWGDGSFGKLYLNDKLLTDNVPIPNINRYAKTLIGPFPMEAGEHILKWEFLQSLYLDNFRIVEEHEKDKVIEMNYTNDSNYDEGKIVLQTD
jgi:hypothetical protein